MLHDGNKRPTRFSGWVFARAIAGLVFLLVVLLVAWWPRDAWANPTAHLIYVRNAGAEDCPDEEALKTAVAARLGYEPFRPVADVGVMARVRRERGTYRGEIELIDRSGIQIGVRKLAERTDRCEDIVTAMALTVSILIDPLSLRRASPPPPPTPVSEPAEPTAPAPPAPEPAALAPRPQEASPQPTLPPPTSLQIFAGMGTTVASGLAPAPSLGLTGFGGARVSKTLSLALEGHIDLPSGTDVERGHVSSQTATLAVTPCLHFSPVFACGFAAVGTLSASSSGILHPASDRTFFVAVGPRLGAELPVSASVSLRASADLGIPLARPPLAIDGGLAYEYPPVYGMGLVALVVSF